MTMTLTIARAHHDAMSDDRPARGNRRFKSSVNGTYGYRTDQPAGAPAVTRDHGSRMNTRKVSVLLLSPRPEQPFLLHLPAVLVISRLDDAST